MPLLATKLYLPTVKENHIKRSRLHAVLDDFPNYRFILVTAPAGFGKTSLVTAWLAEQSKKVAWVSLDRNDNDPITFLSYVVEALRQLDSSVCQSVIPLLQSTDPPPPRVLLTYLINDLACLEQPSILVLDDYHLIESAEIHAAIEFLIENAPPLLQILVTSRHTPGFSVTRLRASGELVEITSFDLRFDIEEARQFLQKVMQLSLPEKAITSLERRTEGWVTGLQLAALSMKQNPDAAFVHELSGDDRFIADYLFDEVLAHQPEELRQFLVQTSLLRRFSAPLCNSLLNIDHAQELLLELERANLFLIPLDNRREWYRYHHLFGEMLRSRLEQQAPELLPTLYRQVVEWCTQNGFIEEAIEYALESQDYVQAAKLLVLFVGEPQNGRRRKRLINWLEQMPLELLKTNDQLWPQYILSHFYFSNFAEALDILRRLWHESATNTTFEPTHPKEYPLLSAITLHTTLNANRVRALTQRALAHLPEEARLLRGIAMGHYGSASLMLGDVTTAQSYLADSLGLLEKAQTGSIVLVFRNYQAQAVATQGHLHQAVGLFQEAKNYAYEHGIQEGNTTSSTLINLGAIYYEWNQLEQAAEFIRSGRRLAESGQSLDRLLHGCQISMKLQLVNEEPANINDKLDLIQVVAAKYQNPPLVSDHIAALRSLEALRQGKVAEAERWADSFANHKAGQVSCLQQIEWLAVARIRLATGDVPQAITLLQSLQRLAEQESRQRGWVMLTAVLIQALQQAGKTEEALAELRPLLITAQPEGYIRSFVDEGEPMRQLLEKMLVTGGNGRSPQQPLTIYIQQILNAFPKLPPHPEQPIVESLTPRELEILQLLSEGLSYAQIAEMLTISTNTLKTHVKRIYSKLNVHNRVQAILAGKEASLLTQ